MDGCLITKLPAVHRFTEICYKYVEKFALQQFFMAAGKRVITVKALLISYCPLKNQIEIFFKVFGILE